MPSDIAQRQALQERAKGTNVNAETLLATDYLNHLNEAIMLLEMVSEMPELIEDLQAWEPKSYIEHFQDSNIADKELAIEAYAHAPEEFRRPFEQTIDRLNRCIAVTVVHLAQMAEQGRTEDIQRLVSETSTMLAYLVDQASAIVHGKKIVLGQDQIDQILTN